MHVGLAVYTIVDGKLVAALQRRGYHNGEKRFKDESFRGACQPLVHGKAEEGEEPTEALKREIAEELGTDFGLYCYAYPFEPMKPFEGMKSEGYYYSLPILSKTLHLIRWHESSGGLRLIKEEDLLEVVDLNTYGKNDIVPADKIAMFSDDLAFIRAGFEYYQYLKDSDCMKE